MPDLPSPNHGSRRGVTGPDMVVLHYTGMESATAALDRLCDPEAEVSAHLVIDLDGTVWRLVPDELRSWHAGMAAWGGIADVNSHSLGIELVNPGIGPDSHPFPEPQMRALEAELARMLRRHRIPPERVVGHACVAPGRKFDPGPGFDWRRLAVEGLSVWADPVEDPRPAPAAEFQEAARRFGYFAPDSGCWDAATLALWSAFALRFRPAEWQAPPTRGGLAQLSALAARWPCALAGAV